MRLWDSTLPEPLISGLSFISVRKRTLGTPFEITKKPNESMGERGRYAFFQLPWDASELFFNKEGVSMNIKRFVIKFLSLFRIAQAHGQVLPLIDDEGRIVVSGIKLPITVSGALSTFRRSAR
jgi:CYTH domain-containing protein